MRVVVMKRFSGVIKGEQVFFNPGEQNIDGKYIDEAQLVQKGLVKKITVKKQSEK